jgi:N-acetylated-alpha-linked acidic dipeptidase
LKTKGTILLAFACSLSLLSQAPADDASAMRGYSPESARAQREWEAKYRIIPDAARLRAYVERLSAQPNQLGSAYDKANAEWILSQFKSWGLDARIETFEVLFPTPRERLVEMISPGRFTTKLQEPTLNDDPTSAAGRSEQLPTYNAYSIDGDVTGPLVYVNYGVPEDYEQLDRLGISVKGAIVIARYGGSWRGIKPKVAAEHGAVGCLIYSDPRDDGYFEGEVFPGGPYRPRDGVQRGSAMDMPLYPGDPLTPGVGATKDAKRLKLEEVKTLTRIPVLPISYGDAEPLLTALRGPVAPENWRGALPITYRVGPGPARVHMKVLSNWGMATLYDVIARIPGSQYPDEWIIRGNHHDAWVYGADDPSSAMASVMEEARAMAELLKTGWKPKRTIIICSWDGEEEGLLGSTEWAEAHAAELRRKTVAYINTDAVGRGYLRAEGSHSLETLVNEVARDIQDPEKNISLWKRSQLKRIADSPSDRKELRSRPDLRISALGSGSDYTAFIDHLGIASLNLGFSGEGGGGVYHSIYDDFYWYTHFADTDFVYGRALAQTAGTIVMRLANADVLPYGFTNLADTVTRYTDEIEKLWRDKRDEIEERNRQIQEGVFTATADPKEPSVPPMTEAVPPYLNFAPLRNGVQALAKAADGYEAALRKASLGARMAEVNQTLLGSERALTSLDGLPGRPWYRHLLYAPGFYTGYGVKTIPGVREAVEQKKWAEAEQEIGRAGHALEQAAALIDTARQQIESAK